MREKRNFPWQFRRCGCCWNDYKLHIESRCEISDKSLAETNMMNSSDILQSDTINRPQLAVIKGLERKGKQSGFVYIAQLPKRWQCKLFRGGIAA